MIESGTGPARPAEGTAGVRIRPAAAEDAPVIAELCGQLGYPTTAHDVVARLEAIGALRDHDVSVAELSSGAIAGWIHCYVRRLVMLDPVLEVDGLVVDERHRRSGIGALLMAHAESLAAERGCRVVNLRSNVTRGEAHGFYRRLGYELAKRQAVFRREMR